jgi:hypothetical protein
MAGFGGDRLTQVRTWVRERAAGQGSQVSTRTLCETAVARLGVSGVALTLDNSPGWPETAESTSGPATQLAELEVTVGEGPCLDAHRDGRPVLIADLDGPAGQYRWPVFAPLAVEAGANALFALPMCVGAIRVGVLALHRVLAGRLEPAELADSLAFAELALRLLLDEQAGLPAAEEDSAAFDDLPLHSAQVHQATGVVSEQIGVGIDDAFARLRARAFADRRPLVELATDVVAHQVRFDE